jgi:hypothetical protein
MTQQQAQTELQEIEKIAQAILNQQTEYNGIKLPKGQRCGTYYQQRSYALIKAREVKSFADALDQIENKLNNQ